MKRLASTLLQYLRSPPDSSDAARRSAVARGLAANTVLRAEDGYDWLRQIKRA
jgi:hypothetical protein